MRRNRPPLTPEQAHLAETKYGLAVGLARQAYHRWGRRIPLDDLLSVAHLTLVHAAADYRPDLGIAFGAFATVCIRRQLRWLRRQEYGRPRLRLFSEISEPEEEAFDPADTREVKEDATPAVQWLQQQVKPRVWRVLQMHFLEGQPFRVIGATLHLTTQACSVIVHKVRERMQERTGVPWR